MPPSKGNSNPRKIWSRPTLTCIPRESITDTHTSSLDQCSGSTQPCALRYATHPHPRGQSLVDNRLCQSRYEQRNISRIGYRASIVTRVRSSYRSMALSAGLATGVNKRSNILDFICLGFDSVLVMYTYIPGMCASVQFETVVGSVRNCRLDGPTVQFSVCITESLFQKLQICLSVCPHP